MDFVELAFNFKAIDNLGMAYLRYAIPELIPELRTKTLI